MPSPETPQDDIPWEEARARLAALAAAEADAPPPERERATRAAVDAMATI